MGNPRCKWVRDRLPLLAGEELRGLDLRKVERHLIGCPKCRRHRVSMDEALSVLHTASAHSPAPHNAPSLWPELARQIRDLRRPAARTPLFVWPRRFGFRPAFALGLSVALIAAAIIAVGSRRPPAGAKPMVDDRIASAVVPAPAPQPAPVAAPEPSPEPASKPQTEMVSAETVPANRVGYDLDHAAPMPTGAEAVREKTH